MTGGWATFHSIKIMKINILENCKQNCEPKYYKYYLILLPIFFSFLKALKWCEIADE
jgi:hypothetical protein